MRRLSVLAILSPDSAATRRYFSQSFGHVYTVSFYQFFLGHCGFLPEITHECGGDKGCVCVCVLAKFAFCPLPWRKLLSKVVSLSPLTHKFDCRTYLAISFRFLSPHFSLCSRISCYCFLCVFAIVFSCIVRSLPFSFFFYRLYALFLDLNTFIFGWYFCSRVCGAKKLTVLFLHLTGCGSNPNCLPMRITN